VNGESRSRATKQLLGPLIEVDPAMIELTIARELQSVPGDMLPNNVADIDATGATISESFTRSANELWTLLQVR